MASLLCVCIANQTERGILMPLELERPKLSAEETIARIQAGLAELEKGSVILG